MEILIISHIIQLVIMLFQRKAEGDQQIIYSESGLLRSSRPVGLA